MIHRSFWLATKSAANSRLGAARCSKCANELSRSCRSSAREPPPHDKVSLEAASWGRVERNEPGLPLQSFGGKDA